MKAASETMEYSRAGKQITAIDKALDRLVSGVAIVTTCCEGMPYGMTAAWFARASNEPYMVTVSVWEKNFTHGKLIQSGNYAINILDEYSKDLAVHFGRQSGRDADKFARIPYRLGESGAPILVKDCVAYIDCRTVDTMKAGDHTVFLGQVLRAEMLGQCDSLVYHRKDFP